MLIILLMFSRSFASEWFCTEESSSVSSSEIHACGVSYSPTESEGRAIALESAIVEFNMICSHSDSCRGRKYDLIPSRTECHIFQNGYKCYRMVNFLLK